MFDLARLTEFAGGVLGQSASNIDASVFLQHLSEEGADPPQFQNLGADEVLALLSENGIDASQVDADQLGTIAEDFGVADHLPEMLGQFTDRAA